ncbi:MAG: hypothetical protein MZU79_02920 [Anaerotruncus sp.]|nr:hypothetical protein [Anaerotruncus sp.]
MRDTLGGKGAGLAEMTNAGAAGAPGLHHHHRGLQPLLRPAAEAARRRSTTQIEAALAQAREAAGQEVRRRRRPAARVACAPARSSRCPGMMDTILNLGLNDAAGRRA